MKTPELLIRPPHFSPLQIADSKAARELEMMKPIKLLLLKIHHGIIQYAAVTAAGGEYFSFVLNNQSLRATDPCYALITVEGDVLCTTNNLTVVTCAQMIARNDCQRMLSYTALLNGTINSPIILSEFIKEQGWTQQQFTSLAQQIGEVQVSVSSEPLLNHAVLYELCGWQRKDHQLQTSNPRYKQPQLLQNDKTFHTLRPLKEEIECGLPLIPTPKRALAGYLFSDKPRPVARTSDEFQLAMQIVELDSMQNIHNIPGKDFALGTLRQSSQLLINSILPVSEKLKLLQERIKEFVDFDKFLDDLHEKLMKFSSIKNLAIVTTIAQTAIKNAYIQFAKGIPIAACKKQFKDSLHDILQTAEEKSPPIRFFGKTVALPKSTNNSLAELLKTAEKCLEDPGSSSTSTSSPVKK